MAESTRPLPPLIPLANGGWEVNSFLSSPEYTLRGLGLMPPNHVVPVIVVPGIMGSNLRARQKPRLGRREDERNGKVKPGQPVWRPPNGTRDGLMASFDWERFSPRDRQQLFDAASLEVDDAGPVALPDAEDGYRLAEADLRARGWGEVHADSYGPLLSALQSRLNQTFGYDERARKRYVRQHWKDVMACDPRRWGVREFAPLTEAQLERHAHHYFPVYAVGYCWLLDCETSSQLLEQRINAILDFWTKAKRRCDKVILVTHSMGGLVARACARRIPDKIGGVIHGVMPALGAPVAYRRLACGTETSSPSLGPVEHIEASRLAKILGATAELTTPVLSTSPGALELLPNHDYPQPWLHVRVIKSFGPPIKTGLGPKDDAVRYEQAAEDYLHLPNARTPNPYDIYRDMTSWYRLINPGLADPARKYANRPGGVRAEIRRALATAEKFHRGLGDYYHPNSYSFHGDDQRKLAYGQVRWVARCGAGSSFSITGGALAAASFVRQTPAGQRRVLVEGKTELSFQLDPQESGGDGTVPRPSGAGAAGKVKGVFPTQGYDHQGSYKNDDMLMLTLRLIVNIVQEMS